MAIKILRVEKDFVKIPLIKGHWAKAIIWPGMGAKNASIHYVEYAKGQESVGHIHPYSEDVFYIVRGKAIVLDETNSVEHPVEEGCVVYVEPGTKHMVRSLTDGFLNVGGPCPPDKEMYIRAGLKW